MGKQLRRLLILLISVFLTQTVSVHSKQITKPRYDSCANSQQSDIITSEQKEGSKTNRLLGDPARTLFEIQTAIRALSNAHNDILRSITSDKPWWVRQYVLTSLSYSTNYVLNDETLYLTLKKLSNSTADEEILLQNMHEGATLPDEIQIYLQNLNQGHSQTGQDSPKRYSLFKEEDWRKWKERWDVIRKHVRTSTLKYKQKRKVYYLLDKIEAFQDDFSDQYFRSHAIWIYYYRNSWLDIVAENGRGAANIKKAATKKLRRLSKTLSSMVPRFPSKRGSQPDMLRTLADKLRTWRRNFKLGWKPKPALRPLWGLPEWVNQTYFRDPGVLLFLITVPYVILIVYLTDVIVRNIAVRIRRNGRPQQTRRNGHRRETRRRVLQEDSKIFSEDDNNNSPMFLSRVPEDSIVERIRSQNHSHPSEFRTANTRPDETPFEYRPLTSLSRASSRRANESDVSFKMAKTSQGPRRKTPHIGSVNGQGPIPRSKLTDSIRVGGRRINMVYDNRDEDIADDSEEEIVAIVSQSSNKENNVMQSGKHSVSKHTKHAGSQGDTGDSDMIRYGVSSRKTRQALDEAKRLLVDASNTSHRTEDTRVLRSRTNSATTKSTDLPAKADTKEKSKLPRRRSARLSVAHSNEGGV